MNRGGAAFPFVSHGGLDEHQAWDMGMSLRDWFAGQALIGVLSREPAAGSADVIADPLDLDKPKHVSIAAEWAYSLADAMLAEREARP